MAEPRLTKSAAPPLRATAIAILERYYHVVQALTLPVLGSIALGVPRTCPVRAAGARKHAVAAGNEPQWPRFGLNRARTGAASWGSHDLVRLNARPTGKTP